MNNKQRIINTVLGKPVDRLPFAFYFGPWGETEERWHAEGLPAGKPYNYNLGMDSGFEIILVNYGYWPWFDYEVIQKGEDTSIVRDAYGIVQEINNHHATIPRYIEYPVKDRSDWLELKKRLDPDSPERFPSDWKEQIEHLNSTDKVVQLGVYPYGLFGTLRDMMGVEELLVSFYTQPELIHEMMDYLTDFWIRIYEKVVKDVRVDAIHMWEDMSAKNGSLISPQMVREFMMPNYKKIRKFADEHDIPIFSLDTDGDVRQLVPLFLECGINLIFPFEVAAGCDINEYRKQYPELCIMGGIDKQEIARGKEGTDRELKRLEGMFDKSARFIPALDHQIHPQVSYSDFLYFIKRLKEYIGISDSK